MSLGPRFLVSYVRMVIAHFMGIVRIKRLGVFAYDSAWQFRPLLSVFCLTSHTSAEEDVVKQGQEVPQRLLWEPQPHVQQSVGCAQLPGGWQQ